MEATQRKHLGTYGALLSLTEIGLGSLLHAFYVPFAGHFLSLNQGFLLTHALKKASSEQKSFLLPTQISNIGALLKSLSPAGKKLTPMLAITAQGYFFSLGVMLFGPNLLGFLLGMTLLSLWAFAQPVLIYYLIFGRALFTSYLYLLETLNKYLQVREEFLLYLLVSVVGLKVILGWLVVFGVYFTTNETQDNWFKKLDRLAAKVTPNSKNRNYEKNFTAKLAAGFKGLTHPLFVISLFITLVFFIFSESKDVHLFWVLARPLAIAFLIHFAFQFLPTEKWVKQLSHHNSTFAAALVFAISRIKRGH